MGTAGRKVMAVASVILFTLVFVIWAAFFVDRGNAMTYAKTQDVKVVKAVKQDIVSNVSAPGTVEEIERKDIYAPQPLRVKNIYVKNGDRVRAGQRILEYDVSQLQSEYDQLLITKKIQIGTLEKIMSADATKGTTALEVAVSQAMDGVNTAWAAYDSIKAGYDKIYSLYRSRKISSKDLEKAGSALKQANAAVKTAEYGYDVAKANLDEVIRMNEQITGSKSADMKIQQENLKVLSMKIDEAGIILDDIAKSSVSPISGIVANVYAVKGGFANIQMPVASIVNNEKLQVRANIKEFDAYRVKVGQRVAITSDTLDGDVPVPGTVKEVSAIATVNRNLSGEETVVEAIISIDGASTVFMPGLSATCKITTAEKDNAIVVSYVSIKEDKDGSKSVFIVDRGGRIVNQPVKLGISSEMDVEVLEGVNEGNLVVTNWQPSFKTGDKARIID